jgi:hypothetical protein
MIWQGGPHSRREVVLTDRGAALLLALTVALMAAAGLAHSSIRTDPLPAVVVYEDGSGVQYQGDTEVRTFPERTFVGR